MQESLAETTICSVVDTPMADTSEEQHQNLHTVKLVRLSYQ